MTLFDIVPGAPIHLTNTASPWADQLQALYSSPHTSAITVRTSTLHGFTEDPSEHQMAFFGPGAQSSTNCYGYSPYPLVKYLDLMKPLIRSKELKKKQVIVSVTGNLEETEQMLVILQKFAVEMEVPIAAEFNASCPNIKGHPPPAYNAAEMKEYVTLLAKHASSSLKVGIKLPPYTYETQFDIVIDSLASVSSATLDATHPISFLTATNTLGQGLVFADQIVDVPSASVAQKSAKAESEVFAVPGPFGGLAGAHIHNLALGNVYRLSTMLKGSQHKSLASIQIIGVGGACDKASVERFIKAGASAVGVATALGREGVPVFAKLAGASYATKS